MSSAWREVSFVLASASIVMPKAKVKALVANFICQRPKVMRMRRGVVWPLASCTASSSAETA